MLERFARQEFVEPDRMISFRGGTAAAVGGHSQRGHLAVIGRPHSRRLKYPNRFAGFPVQELESLSGIDRGGSLPARGWVVGDHGVPADDNAGSIQCECGMVEVRVRTLRAM